MDLYSGFTGTSLSLRTTKMCSVSRMMSFGTVLRQAESLILQEMSWRLGL